MSAAQNISQSLEPQVESDGINVTKVERIVENKVNRLVPRISERVEQQVNTFDPNQMLASIFRNGPGWTCKIPAEFAEHNAASAKNI